eukprot:PITA_17013
MWLVHRKKILTWDNIRKRGVIGPSRCQLCEAQEETMEHILNNYTFTTWLWDYFATIFHQTDRDKESIINTLNKWRKNFSENELLNLAWAFTPSFIIWNVWKERNKRIFKEEKTIPLCLLDLILKQIKETVSITVRNYPKNSPTDYELRTLMQLGNPGIAGYGGVLRDEEGNIIFVFHYHLGIATNNMAELMALEQCLELLKLSHSSNVIVEADSEISINAVKRINCGIAPEKVSQHWRLIQVYKRIQNHLLSLRTISFNHVQRKSNKLTDTLANQGVINSECRIELKW